MSTLLSKIVSLTQELDRKATTQERRDEIMDDLRLVGQTADYFGGFGAMTKLSNDAEALVGRNNSVSSWLNEAWHGVGVWMA